MIYSNFQNIGQNVFVAVLTLEDLAEADERYQSYKLSVQSVLSDTVASVTINLAEGKKFVGICSLLTLVLLNCFNCIFRHLKLELLTQFPASNDEKDDYLWKIDMSKIKSLDQLSIY